MGGSIREKLTADESARPPDRTVLFVGSSVSADDLSSVRADPTVEVRPPIRRGDLPTAVAMGIRCVAIIDGEFYQRLAVSPKEILAAMYAGVRVVGGASMGALRAAELWPHGMDGYGVIYRWYRSGQVTRDDDVAVSYSHDEDDYRPLTVPWVNVKWLMDRAGVEGWLGSRERRRTVLAARAIHWESRTWPEVCLRADLTREQVAEVSRRARDPGYDRKRLDALEVIAAVAGRSPVLDRQREDA